jgi:predicted Fe-Mo cluster-binding NifX family protein
MKIVTPALENGHINSHFGHSDLFTVFTTDESGVILSQEKIAAPEGCGCKSNLVESFAQMGVSICLAGNMGPGAVTKFQRYGIDVIRGCSGDAAENVKAYLAGKLSDSGENCDHQGHHQHEDGHKCNHHS